MPVAHGVFLLAMSKGLDPASCEAAREQLAQTCGQLLRDASASSASLALVDWYLYVSVTLGALAIFLHLFGGALSRWAKATEHRLRADLASAADAARSAERDAAGRQRLRDLANAEMDRLWRLKHGGR